MNSREFLKAMLAEVKKHANRDECYGCRKLLRECGIELKGKT